MIKKIYAVYDSKSESFGNPFFQIARGEALRSFTTASNDPNTSMYIYPADYTLFELGDINLTTGQIIPHHTPVSLGLAQEFKSHDAKQTTIFEGARQ